MEYQIRREGDEAWILIPVRIFSKVQGNQVGLTGEVDGVDDAKKAERVDGAKRADDVDGVDGANKADGIDEDNETNKTDQSDETGGTDEAIGVGSGKQRKLGAEKLQREILKFCNKPRSRKEIAQQFEFSTSDYVIQKYVLSLVRSRMLQMTIPDHPRSKNQKYFSIQIPLDENETT